jgi:hypothetical protein
MSSIKLIALSLSISCILMCQYTYSQDKIDRKAQLASQKVAFITNKLKLTVAESQKFWPVYNEYQQKRDEIIVGRKQISAKYKLKASQYTEDELDKLSDEFIQSQIKESNLMAEYHSKFKEALGVRKTFEFYMAEEQFKVWLLNEMKRNGNPKGQK